jgi:multiple sugar transport system permease protein
MRGNSLSNRTSRNLIHPRKDIRWLFPGFLAWVILFFFPFCLSLITSFYSDHVSGGFLGLEHYNRILQDSYYLLSVKNTLIFLCSATVVGSILGLVTAQIFFSLPRFRGMILILAIPLFLPSPTVSAIWRAIGGSGSWLVRFLKPGDEPWKYALLFLVFIWKNTGAVAILFLTGMKSMDPLMLDAARTDGAHGWKLFCYIELPQLKTVSGYVLFFLVMNGIRIFREAYMLYGTYPPANLFFIQHYINLSFARLDYGVISAAGTLLSFLLLIPLSLLLRKLSGRGEIY